MSHYKKIKLATNASCLGFIKLNSAAREISRKNSNYVLRKYSYYVEKLLILLLLVMIMTLMMTKIMTS